MSYSEKRSKGDYRWVPEVSGIYRLYHGDKVVYVGETNNILRRIQQHEQEMGQWGSYDYKTTRGTPKAKRKKMESRSISRNKPTRNKKR